LSDNNVVRENTFKKNKQGIFEEDCEGNVIENNIVEDDFELSALLITIIVLIIIGISAPLIIILVVKYKRKWKEQKLEKMRKEALETE
jgi:parallel beta-helix repeat protein